MGGGGPLVPAQPQTPGLLPYGRVEGGMSHDRVRPITSFMISLVPP